MAEQAKEAMAVACDKVVRLFEEHVAPQLSFFECKEQIYVLKKLREQLHRLIFRVKAQVLDLEKKERKAQEVKKKKSLIGFYETRLATTETTLEKEEEKLGAIKSGPPLPSTSPYKDGGRQRRMEPKPPTKVRNLLASSCFAMFTFVID